MKPSPVVCRTHPPLGPQNRHLWRTSKSSFGKQTAGLFTPEGIPQSANLPTRQESVKCRNKSAESVCVCGHRAPFKERGWSKHTSGGFHDQKNDLIAVRSGWYQTTPPTLPGNNNPLIWIVFVFISIYFSDTLTQSLWIRFSVSKQRSSLIKWPLASVLTSLFEVFWDRALPQKWKLPSTDNLTWCCALFTAVCVLEDVPARSEKQACFVIMCPIQ